MTSPFSMARYALFSGTLAFAGLPVYVHAPKFFADTYGVSLAAIGFVLLALRILDFAQDPFLGWFSDRLGALRPVVAALTILLLAFGIIGLFAIEPLVDPLLWMALMLVAVFTAYSLMMILLYTQGVALADEGGDHVQIAAWRETGALIGVCCACAAPSLFAAIWSEDEAFAIYATVFLLLSIVTALAMEGEWREGARQANLAFGRILSDPYLKRLLVIGIFNAAPIAVTSSLFLFFVEYKLEAPDQAGLMLITFFVAAACGALFWTKVAQRTGARWALIFGMALSILAFWWAGSMGPGEILGFYAICLLSGFALGADMTLLPAMFAQRLQMTGTAPGQAFGLWNFCAKITLALAAGTALPLLEASGFQVGGPNPPEALETLAALYALVPCALKGLALFLLILTSPGPDETAQAEGAHAFARP